MILRRLTENLRAQNWTAISLEFLIVVIGVFIGTWVANWNEKRAERRETAQLLRQLKPELRELESFSLSARTYYATTNRYAETAFAGWARDPKISDRDFVIAAYQASQIYGFGNNGASWALVFGGDELRKIEDPRIRAPLTRLMTFEYGRLNYSSVASRYRDEVRQVVPDSIQQKIRQQCGDRINADHQTWTLPDSCSIDIPPNEVAAVAADLRRHPELVGQLDLHRSGIATYLLNLDLFDGQWRQLARGISTLDD